MPSVVPAPLARVAALLRCPTCSLPLAAEAGALRCARRHAHDAARHGYVTLAAPARRPATGDTAAMVAARAAVLDAGHFAPLSAALAALAARSRPRVVLDVGAGTGHHLAAVADALPDAAAIALDASRPALRRAARAHPRIAAVRADVWRQVPLGDATVDLALNVFAPRQPAELARVLRPGGTLVVVTPAAAHLRELAALHRVRIEPRKRERLLARLRDHVVPVAMGRLAWTLELTHADAAAVLRMGPAAHHLAPDAERRLHALPAPLAVTAAVELHVFRRLSGYTDPVELDTHIRSVEEVETRSGKIRYVVRDDEGREYTTFRPAIGREAAKFEGRRAHIAFHEEERNGFQNVYLDAISEAAGGAPEPGGSTDPDEVAWNTAVEAAPWMLGSNEPQEEIPPEELYEKLEPFKRLVAEDIREGSDRDAG